MRYFVQPSSPFGRTPQQGLGSWFSRTVSNVGKFVQQTDLVSHAASELGVGKSTVGKILVPTASDNINKYQTIVKSDIPKPAWTVNAENCANSKYMNDPKCVEFNKAQAAAQTSQQIIAVPEDKVSKKTKLIVGGAIAFTVGLVILSVARGRKKKALSGVPRKAKRKSVRKVKSKK